jgi:hypothetical protein
VNDPRGGIRSEWHGPERIGRRLRSKATKLGHDTMRSRLERDFALHLFLGGEDYVYEPRLFGPRGRRYLPDFLVTSAGRPTYVEVKPRLEEVEAARAKMAVIWEEEPDALLVVACAEGCTFSAALLGGEWEEWVELWKHR